MFSGIEAVSVACEDMGWEALAFAEIDPFPSAILAERFPDIPNLGDVTKVKWKKYKSKCDLVVGGSPCQSFSIAGKREGLKVSQDSCSSTFAQYVRYVLDGFFGKTSRERSQAKVGRLSDSSCPKWTSSGMVWRGAYLMRSSSEWPKDAVVSFLSDILEPAPPSRHTY